MKGFFDCKFYSTTNYSSLELTFYGIAENTVADSVSFEMAYNLIAEWARPYKGVGCKNSYSLGKVKQKEAESQAQLGHLAPFPETPNKTSSLEPATSADTSGDINGDHALPQDDACSMIWSDSEIIGDDGFDGHPGPPDEQADESSEDSIEPDFKVQDEYSVNPFGDFEEEISKLIKPEPLSPEGSFGLDSLLPLAPRTQSNIPPPLPKREPTPTYPAETEQNSSKPSELEPGMDLKWTLHMLLVTFPATATKIENQHLEDKGVKLHRRSARSTVIRDRNANNQGVKDSRKIDVHRKSMKE